ncbi:CopG family ribbon-helix-helix protein [Silvibacterium acidisoli]|uniref:CopG family ribbon-helix-helix protein n=1 Tax=Acidobacteriaceae bacterium ZG23-2 TaxID=2883246 RepID=UPI00406C673F
MEVHLSASLESKLSELAANRGQNSEALAVEAIERLVAYEGWFLGEVQKGEDAADRGDFVDQAAVKAFLDRRYQR